MSQVIKDVSPSVSTDVLQEYLDMKKEFGGSDDNSNLKGKPIQKSKIGFRSRSHS